MDILTLKSQWNDVLDNLEKNNRVAWIAFFDARLASLESNRLILDFSDARKLAGGHEYSQTRLSHLLALKSSIKEVTGSELEISEME